MLMRNLSTSDGLCNRTRLKIIDLYKFNINAKIMTGTNIGEIVYIPRIELNTGEHSSLPFVLYRRQFPVVLAFAITINKSQGQTFESMGLLMCKYLCADSPLKFRELKLT